jgi:RND family efflux transporter MFP subunit
MKKILNKIRNLPRLYSIGGAVLILALVGIGLYFVFRSASPDTTPAAVSHVELASVASLAGETDSLSVTGKVTSVSQAIILAQTSGEIVSLNHALGDRVAAGSVIASFENSSQEASVLQAEGGYDAARAALAKASGSTAQNQDVTSAEAAQNAANSQASAVATIQSAYVALDDAVHTKADVLFTNPHSQTPTFINGLSVPDSNLVYKTQSERAQLEGVLTDASSVITAGSSGNVDSNISQLSADAEAVVAYFNDLVQIINKAVPSQAVSASALSAYQVSVGAARSEVIAAISSLTSAKTSYDSAISGAATASNTASTGTLNDIASAQANVKSALGALDAAKANLEKTIIRSPISGTIVTLSITQGGFVSSFAQVAQVSNPGTLEVDAYITSDDAKTLAIGDTADIGGTTKGVIVFIAPALDPTTGKIQVKIGIQGDQSKVTSGDTVTVALNRAAVAASSTAAFSIPIVSAKITPAGPVVFTVSASSTLVASPITFGAVLGSQVTVTNGLRADMIIVTDARGLSDGQQVIVDQTK